MHIGYITAKKNGDCENIHSINLLYLIIGKVNGWAYWVQLCWMQFHWRKIKSKYLVFDCTDETKKVFKKYRELWDEIKNEIETINSDKKVNMVKILWKLNLIQMIICH